MSIQDSLGTWMPGVGVKFPLPTPWLAPLEAGWTWEAPSATDLSCVSSKHPQRRLGQP